MARLPYLALLFVVSSSFSDGFVPQSTRFIIPTTLSVGGNYHGEEEHTMIPSKPKITSLNSLEEFEEFLKADDTRICAIKFHASWCKSCKLFGKQYERIGNEIGDLVAVDNPSKITRKGEIRLAEIEYGKNAQLCKSLQVKKVPSIFFYYSGRKIDGFPCGPKKIAHTLERLSYFRSLSPSELAFEAEMQQGDVLGDEILGDIVAQKNDYSDKHSETSLPQTEQSSNSNR